MAAGAVAEVEAYSFHILRFLAGTKVRFQVLLHDGELAPQGFPCCKYY